MKKYIAINLLYILLTVLLAGCLDIRKENALSKLEGLLDKYSKEQCFGGTVLIVDNGKTLIEKGYGMADYDVKIKNNPDTIFRLGSITKQFTAMCILMLE